MKSLPFGNIFRNSPRDLPDEEISELLNLPGFRIERIVSRGHASAPGYWYDQSEGEWVLLLKGAARLKLEGEESDRLLAPGDWLYIPPHLKHRVEWTDPKEETVWLAVFTEL